MNSRKTSFFFSRFKHFLLIENDYHYHYHLPAYAGDRPNGIRTGLWIRRAQQRGAYCLLDW